MKDFLPILNQRKSRRTYLPIPVEKEKLKNIQNSINQYNEESGLSFELLEDGSDAFNGLLKSYGLFSNVRSLLVLKGQKDDIHLDEKCGFYGELLLLQVEKLNLGTCWVGVTFDMKNSVLNIGKEEHLVSVITFGNTSEQITWKENFFRTVSHGKARPLTRFYKADKTPPDWFLEGVKAVQKAPSAVNRQNYLLEYKNDEISISTNNTKKFDMVDLGIAKAHFCIAVEGIFELGNPAIFRKK